MQAILLELDEKIKVDDFMQVIRKVYGPDEIKAPYIVKAPTRAFDTLPSIAENPIQADEFTMFTREELHER